MQRNIFIPWCEWQLAGMDNIAFSSRYLAQEWLNTAIMEDESLKEQFPFGFKQLEEEGLAGVIAHLLDPIN
jgi:hypothetical protein